MYAAVVDMPTVRRFMAHHIFSVWDFMSLLKYLQARLAPAQQPWGPVGDPTVRRFINEIVLEEESDQGMPGPEGSEPTFASHFELYAMAMEEVGASAANAHEFVARVTELGGLEPALDAVPDHAPVAAQSFMRSTFAFIAGDRPHEVAAAFAFGREQIIPAMFRALLAQMAIDGDTAPAFHYYLERHIHLDEDHHGPLSLRMLDYLCDDDPEKIAQAQAAAERAILARIAFWDGVLADLQSTK
ncbi:putative protein of unknown function, family DUF3050 [Magnetofaba australis IT-1]|uniref:Heme oxygenase n=1 Tax=Magnetofaba australis IT-1 TaxID=1434232 RepID=A0A1Y2JYT7_9PROT|nr:putative protein of unknown function, family DUF3050 [Magnetofaba australis IT-1]